MNTVYDNNLFTFSESGRSTHALNLGQIVNLGFSLKETAEMSDYQLPNKGPDDNNDEEESEEYYKSLNIIWRQFCE